MSDDLVQILDGNTFVVSDARGDIEAFAHRPDRPLLVRYAFPLQVVLTINGQRLSALSTDDLQHFDTRFFLVAGRGRCMSTRSCR